MGRWKKFEFSAELSQDMKRELPKLIDDMEIHSEKYYGVIEILKANFDADRYEELKQKQEKDLETSDELLECMKLNRMRRLLEKQELDPTSDWMTCDLMIHEAKQMLKRVKIDEEFDESSTEERLLRETRLSITLREDYFDSELMKLKPVLPMPMPLEIKQPVKTIDYYGREFTSYDDMMAKSDCSVPVLAEEEMPVLSKLTTKENKMIKELRKLTNKKLGWYWTGHFTSKKKKNQIAAKRKKIMDNGFLDHEIDALLAEEQDRYAHKND